MVGSIAAQDERAMCRGLQFIIYDKTPILDRDGGQLHFIGIAAAAGLRRRREWADKPITQGDLTSSSRSSDTGSRLFDPQSSQFLVNHLDRHGFHQEASSFDGHPVLKNGEGATAWFFTKKERLARTDRHRPELQR